MKIFANILILISIIILALIFFPAAKEEVKYRLDQAAGVKYSVDTTEEGTFEKPLKVPNTNFSIVIPKIAAAAPIVENVDSQNKDAYLKALRRGVAHAAGTSFPLDPGNVYLFAHSTDSFLNFNAYNAVFYLIGKLKKGDEIFIYYRDRKIKYVVEEVKVVDAKDNEYLYGNGSDKLLILQTCYPPGTTLKRLIVIAREVGVE